MTTTAGDISNRARFPSEVVAAIRAAVWRGLRDLAPHLAMKEEDYEARIAETPEELETMLSVMRNAGVDIFHASARRFWDARVAGNPISVSPAG